MKKFQNTLNDYNTALSLNFTNSQLTLRRGIAMAELGQNENAVQELKLYLRSALKADASPLQRRQIKDLIQSLQKK